MDTPGTVISEGGVDVSSNYETPDAIRAALTTPDPSAAPVETPAAPETPAAEPVAESTESRARDDHGRFTTAPATADEPPATETLAETPPIESKLGKPRHDPQARINQAIAAQRAAEREAAALRAEIAASQARQAPTVAGNEPPKVEQFEDYSEFVRAQAAYAAKQEFARLEQLSQQTRQQAVFAQRRDARFQGYQARMATVLAADAGFVESLSETIQNLVPSDAVPPGAPVTAENAIADEIIDSEHPEKLQRYLSDHPDEFQRIATLPPRQLTRAMASLEARLTLPVSTGSASKPSHSQAKPPVKPVESAAAVSDEPPGDDASDSAHYRYWQARERQARMRRA